jgi:hypothetical protein
MLNRNGVSAMAEALSIRSSGRQVAGELGATYQPLRPVGVALSAGLERSAVRLAALWGQRDPDVLTNMVFFHRHPERGGRKLAGNEPGFPALSREWLTIRDVIVRPALGSPRGPAAPAEAGQAAAGLPRGPLGTLTAAAPSPGPFRYPFTPEDTLWTARFLVGEAGGRDDPGNHAVIWAMFNRFALFTHTVYPTFQAFIRAYSTPLQPVLNAQGAAKRHMSDPDFVRTGGTYPGTSIPKGQLGRFLRLQQTPWANLPAAARALALRALSGGQPNPGIGNASEFDDTAVYFRDRYKQVPSEAEWRRFTIDFPRSVKRNITWIGDVPGLVQYRINSFFLDNRARSLPAGAVRVLPPGRVGT